MIQSRRNMPTILAAALCAILGLAACAGPRASIMPPMDWAPTLHAADGTGPFPPHCPRAGTVVERGTLPPYRYFGAAHGEPDACLLSRTPGTPPTVFYEAIWAREWPGAEQARIAIAKAIHGPTGTEASFDTVAGPGLAWHEVLRNEGLEDLAVAGQHRLALKLAHYREGFDGNTYRSVATLWKDLRTGAIIYTTYRHISGKPEPGRTWDMTALREP